MTVVPFEPRPPELSFCQLRLHDTTCNIRLVLRDEADNVVVLEYLLVSKWPNDFDLRRLERAWSQWKGMMGKAV